MKIPQFNLWLEFELWQPDEDNDIEDNFFNMKIFLSDGRIYGLSVWTFRYLEHARRESSVTGDSMHGKYLLPPDLFVTRCDRQIIEEVVIDLIRTNQLRTEWLVQSHEDGMSVDQ